MKFKAFIFAAAAAAALVSCNQPDPVNPDLDTEGLEEVSYTAYTYDEEFKQRICNPERGFYSQTSFRSASSLSTPMVKASRTAARTLHLTLFYLTDYIDGDISADYLAAMQETFDNLRAGGGKAIVRFAYKDDHSTLSKPYDATQELVARHIEQVTPILSKNADVIFTVQAGFIGSWGEWYYTTNFHQNISTDEQYADRRKVVDGLLAALPKDRQVELRTPKFKMKMYKVGLADTITVATAHDGSDLSRLAGHNDCYLASSSDTGTFDDKRGTGDWLFWDAESRYTIMGGETCGTGAGLHHCENTLQRMAEQHWSYLNIGYHEGVLNTWRTEKCFNEILARMGYRLTLNSAFFTPASEVVAGGDYRVVLNIANGGWAAPMNPRGCELVLEDAAGKEYVYKIDTDPRFWFENSVTSLGTTITLPENLPAGECKLYLNLPDGYESLASNPLYSIRLLHKGKGMWDENRGYNLLTKFTI